MGRQVHDAGIEKGSFRGPQRAQRCAGTVRSVEPDYRGYLLLRADADQQEERYG